MVCHSGNDLMDPVGGSEAVQIAAFRGIPASLGAAFTITGGVGPHAEGPLHRVHPMKTRHSKPGRMKESECGRVRNRAAAG